MAIRIACECGDMHIINDSAMNKHVVCDNCRRTVHGHPGQPRSTQEIVGYEEVVTYPRRTEGRAIAIAPEPPMFGKHTHRAIRAQSVMGPKYR